MDNAMIGIRIRERRKELRITGSQIQEKTGISTGNLSGIESGKNLPSAVALVALAKALDCSIDWILTGDSPKSVSPNLEIFNEDDKILLQCFHQMTPDDQEEFLMIAQLKANKGKRTQNIKSSLSVEDKTA